MVRSLRARLAPGQRILLVIVLAAALAAAAFWGNVVASGVPAVTSVGVFSSAPPTVLPLDDLCEGQ